MESASPLPNPPATATTTIISTSDLSCRKRNKKSPPSPSLKQWRSEKQQQIYSTKLVSALRDLRINQPRGGGGGRAVRDVADKALAVTARGKTLWSRAILSKSVKLRFMKRKRHRISNQTGLTGSNRSKKQRETVLKVIKGKGLPRVERRVELLSRLVPGCRKQTLPVVLEETGDYISALEMQIRAMTAILSAVNSPLPSPSPSPPRHDGEETHMLG